MSHAFIPLAKLKKRANKNRQMAIPNKPKPKYAPSCSLRSHVNFVYDQGQIGSCTANALAAAIRIHEIDKTFLPSRLWIYFWERLMEDPNHNPKDLTDSGADVIDGEEFLVKNGVCSEKLWPYNVSKLEVQPGAICVTNAKNHKLHTYARITFSDIKHYISNGVPVLIAITVYPSFENSVGGKIPMPSSDEQAIGGHELCLVGYNDGSQTFEVLNSWSAAWGDAGFCHIPYAYLKNPDLCSELTVIKVQ